ncbi:hypothetical protein BGW37DRAFT_501149 [Umbelopsis sp. PMI_123]|nr:hypothetical protein BGW37DRAFT_501149 [Umbelopsis sp. PMI_123]
MLVGQPSYHIAVTLNFRLVYLFLFFTFCIYSYLFSFPLHYTNISLSLLLLPSLLCFFIIYSLLAVHNLLFLKELTDILVQHSLKIF